MAARLYLSCPAGSEGLFGSDWNLNPGTSRATMPGREEPMIIEVTATGPTA